MPDDSTSRSRRRQDLLRLWRTPEGRTDVVNLFHRCLLEQGRECAAGMSMVEIVLDHEFSTDDRSQATANSATPSDAA